MYSDNISLEDKFAPHAEDFFSKFSIGALFRKAGASKARGVRGVSILRYLFFLAFTPYTMAQDQSANGNAVKKDTCHRIMSMPKINWNAFLCLAASAIARVLELLRRKNCKERPCEGKEAIEKYIPNQLVEDKMSEQLVMKELFDPFTGEPTK